MRIVAAHPGPAFSVHDCHVGWTEAFRKLGHPVAEYNLSERLTFYDAALFEMPGTGELRRALTVNQARELAVNGLYATLYKLRPDLLFVTSAFFYPPDIFELARSYGTRVVLLHTESPYEDTRQMALAGHVDVNLLNDPTNLDAFRRINPATYYMPHSYRECLHHPGSVDPNLAADLAFVGTGYRSRIEFLEAVDLTGLDVFLAGNWQPLGDDSPLRKHLAHEPDECLDNEQTTAVYRSSRCGLNLYRREAETGDVAGGWSCGPREIEMAACGLFFLREPRGESDELFPMLPTVTTPGEASELLRWYLARDDARHEAATHARSAITDRTFTIRAAELMAILERDSHG